MQNMMTLMMITHFIADYEVGWQNTILNQLLPCSHDHVGFFIECGG